MKKILYIVALAALVGGTAFAQAPVKPYDRTVAYQLQTLEGQASAAAAANVAAAARFAAAVVANTNAVALSTTVTPAFVGQFQHGTVSNKIWISTGVTTNSWVLLN